MDIFLVQIVNLEWGAFSKGLPLTVFDRDMDAASINPGEQASLCGFIIIVVYANSYGSYGCCSYAYISGMCTYQLLFIWLL